MFISKLFSWICCTTFVAGQFVFQPENVTLRNLVIDSSTGDIFVGGVNYIYKLNKNLTQLNEVYTPCLVSKCQPGESNINQLLMIENLTGTPRLFACGTYLYGQCITYNMQNFSHTVLVETINAVSNRVNYSSVALEDPLKGIVIARTRGDTDDGNFDYSLNTEPCKSCMCQSSPCSGKKKILMLKGTRPKIYYILATIVGSFRYFFGYDKDGTFVARLCEDYYHVSGLKPYVEIPMRCVGKDGANYDQLVAAKVVRSDGKLAEKFGSTGDDDDAVLIGVFQKSREPSQTAVCSYTFKQINESFWKNIEKCFSSNTVVLNKHIEDRAGNPKKCTMVSIAVYFKELLS